MTDWRLGHNLNLRHTLAALTVSRADAVASRITTTDDEYILALCRDTLFSRELHASKNTVLLREQFKGKMHAFQLTARNFQISCDRCANSEDDGGELLLR